MVGKVRRPTSSCACKRPEDLFCGKQPGLYIASMSHITVEVDTERGRVVPREPDKLPEHGNGLLTILPSTNGQDGDSKS